MNATSNLKSILAQATKPRSRPVALLVVALLILTPSATAQPSPRAPINIDSGMLRAPAGADEPQVIFREIVKVPGATSIRLIFGDTRLNGTREQNNASYLRLSSMLDGDTQYLTAETIEQWGYTSAYFNGDAVLVELIAQSSAAPSRVAVREAIIEQPGFEPRTLCGNDDRIALVDNRIARIRYSNGTHCTAFLIGESTLLTAGHCNLTGDTSPCPDCPGTGLCVEFNVPQSTASGATVCAAVEDQYPIDTNSIASSHTGIGDDWAVFGVNRNSETNLTPLEAQTEHYFLHPYPRDHADGSAIRIDQMGTVTAPVSLTLHRAPKTAKGTYVDYAGDIRHKVDTTGGSSGSPIIATDSGRVLGIHTNGGCGSGTASNHGTVIDRVNLRNAIAAPTGTRKDADSPFAFKRVAWSNLHLPGWGNRDTGTPRPVGLHGSKYVFHAEANNRKGYYAFDVLTGEYERLVDSTMQLPGFGAAGDGPVDVFGTFAGFSEHGLAFGEWNGYRLFHQTETSIDLVAEYNTPLPDGGRHRQSDGWDIGSDGIWFESSGRVFKYASGTITDFLPPYDSVIHYGLQLLDASHPHADGASLALYVGAWDPAMTRYDDTQGHKVVMIHTGSELLFVADKETTLPGASGPHGFYPPDLLDHAGEWALMAGGDLAGFHGLFLGNGAGLMPTVADNTMTAPGNAGSYAFFGDGSVDMLGQIWAVAFEANTANNGEGIYIATSVAGDIAKVIDETDYLVGEAADQLVVGPIDHTAFSFRRDKDAYIAAAEHTWRGASGASFHDHQSWEVTEPFPRWVPGPWNPAVFAGDDVTVNIADDAESGSLRIESGHVTLQIADAKTYTVGTVNNGIHITGSEDEDAELTIDGKMKCAAYLTVGGPSDFGGAQLSLRDAQSQIDVPETRLLHGAFLRGIGTIKGDLRSDGTTQAGWGVGTDELVIDGDYTQKEDATLLLALDTAEQSKLRVTGQASLDGTLRVELNGWNAVQGETYTILEHTSRTGQFKLNQLPQLPAGLEWKVNYEPTSVVLEVKAATTAAVGFEQPNYAAASYGLPAPGQGGWHDPVPGTGTVKLYPYAGNDLFFPPNPNGAFQFAAARRDGPYLSARLQKDIDLATADAWRIACDLAAHYDGTLPTESSLGLFGLYPNNTSRGARAILTWDDPNLADAYSITFGVFDAAGDAMTASPGPAWNALPTDAWYRISFDVDYAQNRVTRVALTNLSTGVEDIIEPTDWYMHGGITPSGPLAEGIRLGAVGGTDTPLTTGNTVAFDNVTFEPLDSCIADFNGDTIVNTADVVAFLNAFTSAHPSADVNGDTIVNTADVVFFLNAWVEGCA